MNDWDVAPGAVDIRNNIFVPGRAGRKFLGGSAGFGKISQAMSHNLWFDGARPVAGERNILADPRFVSTKRDSMDLGLQPGSPAIDAGSPAASGLMADDFDAVVGRPQKHGIDIDAYEAIYWMSDGFGGSSEAVASYGWCGEPARCGVGRRRRRGGRSSARGMSPPKDKYAVPLMRPGGRMSSSGASVRPDLARRLPGKFQVGD